MSKLEIANEILTSKVKKKNLKFFFYNPDHVDILYSRIVEGKTLQESGNKFGISRERVRQIEKKFLDSVEDINALVN